MERKTKIHAPEGSQAIVITRDFDLPLELLFTAHADPKLFEQWMSHEYGTTRVLKYETRDNGGWQFETSDVKGNVIVRARGVFHQFVKNKKITRTFEMEGSSLDAQLEFLEFEELPEEKSRLTVHSVFRNSSQRDQLLRLPFAHGLSMAHDRLQGIVGQLKNTA